MAVVKRNTPNLCKKQVAQVLKEMTGRKKYRIHKIQDKINKATLKELFSINEGTFTRQNISTNFGSSR